ncbi:MAG: 2-oxo acid dehydrogenase subunit E2 [Anaerolineae bacterium]|nr:2-oxo acid dehydrogenase subunit E2 [Anaerolineae bacterium]
MPKEVIMPKFGFTQETAEVLAWLVNEGDHVDAGDPIMEVSTDKVSMEVEAPVSGILAGCRPKVGDVVPVTEIIAYILQPGESLPPEALTAPAAAPVAASASAEDAAAQTVELGDDVKASPVALRMAQEAGVDLAQISGSGPRGKVTARDVEAFVQASAPRAPVPTGKITAVPSARRLAAEMDVDLSEVAGTGPGGRIQSEDVLAFVEQLKREVTTAASLPPVAPTAVQTPVVPGDGVAQRVPFNKMRRIIARNLQKSMQDAPHIYFQREVDMTAANALVAYANKHAPDGVKVTLTAVFVRVVAWALRRHPMLNSYLNGEEILVMSAVNVGVAVALEEGLIVPVVKDADRKSLYEIAEELGRLGQAAKANKLSLDEIEGATFTVSNLGMFGVDRFTAIINPPQVGILAVGRARKQFVPDENEQPVLRPLAGLTLSVDHRVIDGAVAARFLADLAEALANLERVLL